MQLRPYRQSAISAVAAGWSEWQRQRIVLPTGAGKTIVFSSIVAKEPGRALVIAHREELVDEAIEKPPKGLIDALAWSLAIRDSDLEGWEPTMKWHKQPASPKQVEALMKAGFWSESITCKGQASLILDKLALRRGMRLATPKQLILLIKLGHPNPELETFEGASEWIDKALVGRRAA